MRRLILFVILLVSLITIPLASAHHRCPPHCPAPTPTATATPTLTPTPTVSPTPTPTATPAPTPTPVATGVQATDASLFLGSVCVNTHLHYSDTPYYKRWLEVRDALLASGVRHVRDAQLPSVVWSYATVKARWDELTAAGVRATLGFTQDANFANAVARAAENTAVEATEGPNELDQSGTGWQTRLRDQQIALWNETRKYSNLSGRPVLVGSLAFTDHWSQVTDDLTPYFSRGNLHSYPGGQTPGSNLTTQIDTARPHFGSYYIWATETGYHNAVAALLTEGHKPTSELAASYYVPQMYLEYYRRGITRTCAYEFLDEWADPEKNDRESNFGLLRNDLTPKPAYTNLKTLMTLLSTTPMASPGRLDYSLPTSTVRHKLFQKSDGTFWLALWNDVSMWDAVNRMDLTPSEAQVVVTLPSDKNWDLYDVRRGLGVQASGTGPASISVSAAPVLLRVSSP